MSTPSTQTAANILVVDDEKVIRLTLRQALEDVGHHVKTAVNGEDALGVLADSTIDLILCDLKMPGMDGMAFLKQLSTDQSEIPAIMISAHGSVANAVEAMKLGAVDFIQKPFTPLEIRSLVQKVLDRPHLTLPEQAPQTSGLSYEQQIEAVKYYASKRQYDKAIAQVKVAIGADPAQAEGFNLLGELQESTGEGHEAIKNYRVALDLDPTHQSARDNLDRATSMNHKQVNIP